MLSFTDLAGKDTEMSYPDESARQTRQERGKDRQANNHSPRKAECSGEEPEGLNGAVEPTIPTTVQRPTVQPWKQFISERFRTAPCWSERTSWN